MKALFWLLFMMSPLCARAALEVQNSNPKTLAVTVSPELTGGMYDIRLANRTDSTIDVIYVYFDKLGRMYAHVEIKPREAAPLKIASHFTRLVILQVAEVMVR
jgi:hypothetical protein